MTNTTTATRPATLQGAGLHMTSGRTIVPRVRIVEQNPDCSDHVAVDLGGAITLYFDTVNDAELFTRQILDGLR